jgi:hypothetical protein
MPVPQSQHGRTRQHTSRHAILSSHVCFPSMLLRPRSTPPLHPQDVFNENRSILEPAGAVAVAGAKAWLAAHRPARAGGPAPTVVAVTSGANMNFERLRLVAELAEAGRGETMLAATIPERPGAFVAFVEAALNATDIAFTELKYRWVLLCRGVLQSGCRVLQGKEELWLARVVQRVSVPAVFAWWCEGRCYSPGATHAHLPTPAGTMSRARLTYAHFPRLQVLWPGPGSHPVWRGRAAQLPRVRCCHGAPGRRRLWGRRHQRPGGGAGQRSAARG